MFTGIVRERGRVVAAEPSANGGGLRLRIEAPVTAPTTEPGDSVAVAGCCLTATAVEDGRLEFDAVPETLARTTLGSLRNGAEVNLEPVLLRYCVEKGSIAVDGVSLTVAALDDRGLAVALVPHTLRETTLAALAPGDAANVEVDLLAKYAERLAQPR